MTDTELIKAVAEFMGWEISGLTGKEDVWRGDFLCYPLTDLNLWHIEIEPMIEEKGLSDKYYQQRIRVVEMPIRPKGESKIIGMIESAVEVIKEVSKQSARDKTEALVRVVG